MTTGNPPVKGAQAFIPDLDNSIFTGHIRDGAVTSGKFAAGAVVAADLADGSVTAAKLAAGAALRTKLGIAVLNETGSTIAIDKLVAVLGFDVTTGLPNVVLADADVASHDDVWVTSAAILNGAQGVVYKAALSTANLNTDSATAAGDPVYLDVTAGGFTHTAPTGATARVLPVGWVVVKSATLGQIAWSIGPARSYGTDELQALAVTAAKLAANAVTGAKLATGVVKVTVAAGVDETAPLNIPVTGMAIGDEVVTVLVFTTAASIATLALHAGTFTAAADGITPGTAVDNTNNQYFVVWIDKT